MRLASFSPLLVAVMLAAFALVAWAQTQPPTPAPSAAPSRGPAAPTAAPLGCASAPALPRHQPG